MACCCCHRDPRRLPAMLICCALGLLFLVAGISKLATFGGFVQYLVPAFAKTFLPAWLLIPYGYTLPFVETATGVLLLLGLWRTVALLLAGLTLLSLAFGQILLQQHVTVAEIFLYVLMTAVALYIEQSCAASKPENEKRTETLPA